MPWLVSLTSGQGTVSRIRTPAALAVVIGVFQTQTQPQRTTLGRGSTAPGLRVHHVCSLGRQQGKGFLRLLPNQCHVILPDFFPKTGFPCFSVAQILLVLVFTFTDLSAFTGDIRIVVIIRVDCSLDFSMHFPSTLSFPETLYIFSIVPSMLVNLVRKQKVLSCIGHAIQMWFFPWLSMHQLHAPSINGI